jgi:Flp pilus assembly protein TadD
VALVGWIKDRGFETVPPESIWAARRHFIAAADADPTFAIPWNNLGDLSFHQRHFGDAEREFQQALADSATYAPAHLNLAQLYEEQGRFPDAEREYRTAIAQDSTLIQAPNNLAHMLAGQGRGAEAIDVLRPALRRWPDVAPLWKNFGIAMSTLGNMDAADSALSQSLELQPEQPEVVAAKVRVAQERARIKAMRFTGAGLDSLQLRETLRALQNMQVPAPENIPGGAPPGIPPAPPATPPGRHRR